MLEKNPKVCIEEMPDPENPSLLILTYGYQAKFNNVHDKTGLLAQINRCKNGVATRDLLDAYEGVLEDINALVSSGDVLAVMNPEDKDRVLFPRGETFLVELDGHVTVPDMKTPAGTNKFSDINPAVAAATQDPVVLAAIQKAQLEKRRQQQQRLLLENCTIIDTDVDPLKQIRRGEAICIGGQWFRVSSAVKEGVPLSEQPTRAQAPPTVTSLKDLSKKNEQDGYIRIFNKEKIPLDHPLPPTALQNLRDAKKAREQLHQFAGTAGGAVGRVVTGGASSQLLSSSASAANPSTLAAAFAKSVAAAASGAGGGGHMRKRPGGGGGGARGGANADSGGLGGGGVHNPPVGGMDRASVAETIETAKRAASDPSLAYSHARRHGCTKDVREIYLATVKDVPESEIDLHNLMIEYKLIEPGEAMRLPRMKKKNANVDNDGKPKKRRYYLKKGQRITNTHLEGTEIGAVLAKAAEKQSQGKSVGDGGM